eukprot:CAMPEP_0182616510 /NCGR_PEP_ID=MMETSP1330-20130603/38575_1 /TAXON_ID=464278 /ORGANISM="Picochlorum sp., Strain RCC944" /LENGTH=191 /DNA_ID=CAMNT_0024836561 /DNA_START=28 /DNA_END=603 /DNA_ORIENTATION=-
MKKSTKIFTGLFAFTFMFAACDQLAFDFTQELVKEFIVEILSGSNGQGTVSVTEQLNLKDGDLDKHRDKIKSAEVKSVVVRFADYVGKDSAMYSGAFQMPNLLPDIYYMNDLDISDYAKNNKELVIYEKDGTSFPDDANFPGDELIAALNEQLLNPTMDQIDFVYTLSGTEFPVVFKATLAVNFNASVGPN